MISLDDLQQFCATDGLRPVLKRPVTVGEYTYASDGRVLVRVPALDGALGFDSHHRPVNFEAVIPGEAGFPFLPIPPGCERCDTEGDRVDCEQCNGVGYLSCSLSYEHDCANCDTRGWFDAWHPIEIGGVTFNCYYTKRIARLPNAMIAPRDAENRALFRFDGGIGVLMPFRQ